MILQEDSDEISGDKLKNKKIVIKLSYNCNKNKVVRKKTEWYTIQVNNIIDLI